MAELITKDPNGFSGEVFAMMNQRKAAVRITGLGCKARMISDISKILPEVEAKLKSALPAMLATFAGLQVKQALDLINEELATTRKMLMSVTLRESDNTKAICKLFTTASKSAFFATVRLQHLLICIWLF